MAGLKRFKYTDKDHADVVADCVARIKQAYGSSVWNDFEEDNTGLMLVEAFAYITDLLLYYLDRQANESYLPTVTERQNLLNMVKLIGYVPENSKSAVVDILVSLTQAHNLDVSLPVGSVLQTANGLVFETQSDAVIKAGELSTQVTATEGETFEEVLGISNGEVWQNFYIQRDGVVGILEIKIAGHNWECVSSFVEQTSESEVFTAEIDAWRRAEILFGDGKTGKIPELDEKIMVRYRIGGGISGNVAPNTITNIRDIATDTNGNRVQVHVTNPDWASGGEEPESMARVKLWAPRYFETQDRCVTQQDYETFAVKFGGICKAHAVVRERSGEANVIRLYVLNYGNIPNTVTTAGQALKDDLLEYLDKYKMLTDWIEIDDAIITSVNFSGTVLIHEGFEISDVIEKVKTAIENFMDIELRDIGEALRISDIYSLIDNIEGVNYVELDTPAKTIIPANNEFLVKGQVSFSGAYS